MTTHEMREMDTLNEVHLVGRLPAPAQERVLPSGDVLCTFRVAITRDVASRATFAAGRRVDSLECVTWNGRVRRSALSWAVGDVIEVSGALRRRFFRTASGAASRVEVEVTSGRRLRRADA